jgi:hypothetical protein
MATGEQVQDLEPLPGLVVLRQGSLQREGSAL